MTASHTFATVSVFEIYICFLYLPRPLPSFLGNNENSMLGWDVFADVILTILKDQFFILKSYVLNDFKMMTTGIRRS